MSRARKQQDAARPRPWVCDEKTPYDNYQAADTQLRRIEGRHGYRAKLSKKTLRRAKTKLMIYRCPFCRKYHLGHPNSPAARRQAGVD